MNLKNIDFNVYLLKTILMGLSTLIIYFKILNEKIKASNKIILFIYIIITSLICTLIRNESSSYIGTMFMIFLLCIFNVSFFKHKIGKSIVFLLISYSINYILFFIAILIMFPISKVLTIKSDLITIMGMYLIELILLYLFIRLKRIKNGFSFITNDFISSDLFDLIILNTSIIIIFCSIIFSIKNLLASRKVFMCFIIFTIIIVKTISKTIQFYYKQKLLINEANQSEIEINKKQEEIKKLETELLNSNKKIHSLIHRQKALEFKVDKLLKNDKNDNNYNKSELKDNLENISKDLYDYNSTSILDKTDIEEIDRILDYMQNECQKNNIEFFVQLNGNIFQMVNDYISKGELEILLSDHIKDAIIAINHSNNVNKSILIKIGYYENCYGIFVYDSGVEFPEEVLNKLGKEPVTTYNNEGGSGIGFMNTFDTLMKVKGSIIIERIGPPCKDNYTKIVKLKFDGKNEFKII